jgi:hypothetical protein
MWQSASIVEYRNSGKIPANNRIAGTFKKMPTKGSADT